MRIATFNIENLDDDAPEQFAARLPVLRATLTRLRADIICFQEVHGQASDTQGAPRSLRALQTLITGTRYADYTLTSTKTKDGRGVGHMRNLVVASSAEFQVQEVKEIHNTLVNPPQYSQVTATGNPGPKSIVWERPTLYVKLEAADGKIFHILNVHFKSKNPTNISGQKRNAASWKTPAGWAEGSFISSMKRMGAALEARMFIDNLFDSDASANILICGDFNAEPHEVSVMTIRGRIEDTNNLELNDRVMMPVALSIPDSHRFSFYHHGRANLLDHMLVSRNLMAQLKNAQIHNELIHDETIYFAKGERFPESDHAPMVAEFMTE